MGGRRFLIRYDPRQVLLIAAGVLLLSLLAACAAPPALIPTSTPPVIRTAEPTFLPTITLTPTLAPLSGAGGGLIAFTTMQGSNWQIYAMNADGSGQRRLTVGVRGGYEPSWSPDGARLVFQYDGLWIADISTADISRISLDLSGGKLENPYLVKPAWSPGGEWIVFLNESGFAGDIYLVRPDGTELKRLTSTGDVSRDGNLVWSPDGKRIAFSAGVGGELEIYVLDIAEALQGKDDRRQLTDSPALVRNLVSSWSPDGSRIAFSSDRDGNMEIYLMDPDGGSVTSLTDHPARDVEPCWSPDGSQIAFSSDRSGDYEIYVLNVNEAVQDMATASVRQLTDNSNEDAGPVWGSMPR